MAIERARAPPTQWTCDAAGERPLPPTATPGGTYPRSDALAAAKAAASGDQQRSAGLANGGVMLWSIERPESVYAASPASDLLVEVYGLGPARARALVSGGAVAPLR